MQDHIHRQAPVEAKAEEPGHAGQLWSMQDMQIALAESQKKQGTFPSLGVALSMEPLDPERIHIDRNKFLGRGTYGYVFKSEISGTPVAVKELGISKKMKDGLSKMLKNELRVSDLIFHPNIVKFMGYSYTAHFNDHCLLLIYEFVDGNNLDNIINSEELERKYGFFEPRKYSVLHQVSQAIAYLHMHPKQIIHGDIKPANIMMTRYGEAKLCDLGLSKIKQDENLTMKTKAIAKGTPLYMAPEQVLMQKTSSRMTDIYSFGATMFEVFFPDIIWDVPDINARDILFEKMRTVKIPDNLVKMKGHMAYDVISKCVEYDPVNRPDALSIVNELLALCKKNPENLSWNRIN